ncbi:plasmid pRiA4b ORF-3 family protein [Clostridium pasteurianum]|uniref:Plasmid pRiA4b ORF-3-like protein n=1 Tax=Clostridium pasteurianum BC1 TaxID=86416 RepID=R4KA63_CLOPA|nr:plasmid pRiA4b ORF-3 family protein [Clostridium pasteurianum]AGK98576.1 Plasmid pRiA4b ORF-3-like protein [Clostridium pasteurianum BC1]
MIINCTKKLQDELKINPILSEVEDPLFSWHANIIKINRRNAVVLVNDASRYSVILYGLKTKEFKNISALIVDAIYRTFVDDGINPEVVLNYLQDAGEIVFSKTQNRTLVSRMNKGCEAAEVYSDFIAENSIIQTCLAKKAYRFIYVDCESEIKHPNEILYEELEKKYKNPIIMCKAIKIKVKLDLEKFHIWRSAIVPLNYTFGEFHQVMQKLFDWKDYHLHDFLVYRGDEPIINIVGSEEDFEYQMDTPMVMESKVKLSDYLPEYKSLKYRYDYGDNWEHIIKVEDAIFDYDKNYSYCLDGSGDKPPEDVGGEHGYEEFIEIMSNPIHEEYEHMKQWADSQDYGGFDIDMVNRKLKYLW